MKINISKRITNDRMLKTLRLLRLAGERIPSVLSSRIVREHFDSNVQSFLNHREKVTADGGFIENQNEFTDMYYGSASVRFSGCEVIAVYNVMRALTGKEPSLPKLIAAFEKNGMIFYMWKNIRMTPIFPGCFRMAAAGESSGPEPFKELFPKMKLSS